VSDLVSDSAGATGGRFVFFEQSNFDVSSTQLRAALQNGDEKSVKQMLSPAVIDYIRGQHLYRIRAMKAKQIKDKVVAALEDVKAQDIRVLEIGDISDFADFMVVASGTSVTHVKALAREASTSLRKQGVKPLNEDGADIGEWVLVDFGDVVLHVMRPEVRDYYDLEKFWDEDVRNLVKQHREQQES
jgi:ribosome-associated protein